MITRNINSIVNQNMNLPNKEAQNFECLFGGLDGVLRNRGNGRAPLIMDSYQPRASKNIGYSIDYNVTTSNPVGIMLNPSAQIGNVVVYDLTLGQVLFTGSYVPSYTTMYNSYRLVAAKLHVHQIGILNMTDGVGSVLDAAVVPSSFNWLINGNSLSEIPIADPNKFLNIDGRIGIDSYVFGSLGSNFKPTNYLDFRHSSTLFILNSQSPINIQANSYICIQNPSASSTFVQFNYKDPNTGSTYTVLSANISGGSFSTAYCAFPINAVITSYPITITYVSPSSLDQSMFVRVNGASVARTFRISITGFAEVMPADSLYREIQLVSPEFVLLTDVVAMAHQSMSYRLHTSDKAEAYAFSFSSVLKELWELLRPAAVSGLRKLADYIEPRAKALSSGESSNEIVICNNKTKIKPTSAFAMDNNIKRILDKNNNTPIIKAETELSYLKLHSLPLCPILTNLPIDTDPVDQTPVEKYHKIPTDLKTLMEHNGYIYAYYHPLEGDFQKIDINKSVLYAMDANAAKKAVNLIKQKLDTKLIANRVSKSRGKSTKKKTTGTGADYNLNDYIVDLDYTGYNILNVDTSKLRSLENNKGRVAHTWNSNKTIEQKETSFLFFPAVLDVQEPIENSDQVRTFKKCFKIPMYVTNHSVGKSYNNFSVPGVANIYVDKHLVSDNIKKIIALAYDIFDQTLVGDIYISIGLPNNISEVIGESSNLALFCALSPYSLGMYVTGAFSFKGADFDGFETLPEEGLIPKRSSATDDCPLAITMPSTDPNYDPLNFPRFLHGTFVYAETIEISSMSELVTWLSLNPSKRGYTYQASSEFKDSMGLKSLVTKLTEIEKQCIAADTSFPVNQVAVMLRVDNKISDEVLKTYVKAENVADTVAELISRLRILKSQETIYKEYLSIEFEGNKYNLPAYYFKELWTTYFTTSTPTAIVGLKLKWTEEDLAKQGKDKELPRYYFKYNSSFGPLKQLIKNKQLEAEEWKDLPPVYKVEQDPASWKDLLAARQALAKTGEKILFSDFTGVKKKKPLGKITRNLIPIQIHEEHKANEKKSSSNSKEKEQDELKQDSKGKKKDPETNDQMLQSVLEQMKMLMNENKKLKQQRNTTKKRPQARKPNVQVEQEYVSEQEEEDSGGESNQEYEEASDDEQIKFVSKGGGDADGTL